MTETELILSAMKMGMPKKQKKRVMKEIEPDPVIDALDDPIWKKASRKPRAPKTVNQWNYRDFVRHVQKTLGLMGLRLESGVGYGRDENLIVKLHDMFVPHFGDSMSNQILRDYLEWWIASYARLQDRPISLRTMMRDYHIARFIKSYGNNQRSLTMPVAASPPVADRSAAPEVSDDELYALGGISMLLMSRGIVVANRVLTAKGEPKPLLQISRSLRSLSKGVLDQVMRTTLEASPYPKQDAVDFISLARPALRYHRINSFDHVQYMDSFKEMKETA